MLAARPHPAGIFFPGWSGASVFDREPEAERAKFPSDAWPRGLARFVTDCSRNFSALASLAPDLLHVRGHTDADRIGVCVSVFARFFSCTNASDHACGDSGLFLGGVRDVPGAGSKFRLCAGWRAAELGTQLHRISFPLEQKFKPFVGLRCVVSESFSARTTVRLQ